MELPYSDDLFRAVFDSASNGIAVLKPRHAPSGDIVDFTVLLFNDHSRQWIGDLDYEGRDFGTLFPKSKSNGTLEAFITVAQTGVKNTFERFYDEDGLNHWFRISAVRQGPYLVVATEDVTERKNAQAALNDAFQAAEQQRRVYESITGNTPDLVYVFDKDYKFTYANKALLAMWGKTAETAIGVGLRENGYEEWHAQMHEREIDDIIANKKPIRGTVSFPHAELGRRVYDYILVPVLDANGEVDVIAGTTRDITELKQAEGKLQHSQLRLTSMIEQTPAPILVLMGDNLVIEQVNKHMLGLLGRGAEVIGMPLIEVLPELEGQYVWEQVQKVYKEGKSFDQSEVKVPHTRDGVMEDHYYNLAYRPLFEDGKITGMIQAAIDVTEQVNARRKLEESQQHYKELSETLDQLVKERTKELKRSNDDLQQFAHVASHDLKEPARKIKTFISKLEDQLEGKLDESALRSIERIHVATNRMFTMIEGVLAYSTTNAGLQKPELVDLNEVIHNIETDLEVALHQANGSINFKDLPTIEGGPVLLYQLFYNLLNNAIKFARKEVPLQISVTAFFQKNKVVVEVQDNGIGFAPEQSERIFESFARLNSKDQFEGTGLGLALCKKIAERHGGNITASGTPGEGAKFFVTLPILQNKATI